MTNKKTYIKDMYKSELSSKRVSFQQKLIIIIIVMNVMHVNLRGVGEMMIVGLFREGLEIGLFFYYSVRGK